MYLDIFNEKIVEDGFKTFARPSTDLVLGPTVLSIVSVYYMYLFCLFSVLCTVKP